MAKTLYLYNDPNETSGAAIRSALQSSGLTFTERNLAADTMLHQPGYGGKSMVIIDVDSHTYAVFPPVSTVAYDHAALLAAWASAPSTIVSTPPSTQSVIEDQTLLEIAGKSRNMSDVEMKHALSILFKRGVL